MLILSIFFAQATFHFFQCATLFCIFAHALCMCKGALRMLLCTYGALCKALGMYFCVQCIFVFAWCVMHLRLPADHCGSQRLPAGRWKKEKVKHWSALCMCKANIVHGRCKVLKRQRCRYKNSVKNTKGRKLKILAY